jgi:hypothetical protein
MITAMAIEIPIMAPLDMWTPESAPSAPTAGLESELDEAPPSIAPVFSVSVMTGKPLDVVAVVVAAAAEEAACARLA